MYKIFGVKLGYSFKFIIMLSQPDITTTQYVNTPKKLLTSLDDLFVFITNQIN